MSFSEILLRWFDENKRDLPWRRTKDPYAIWVSEIILQQTRIAQGIDYYHRFLEKFPTISALANAKEEDVLKVWQGLGYYSRARNMHVAAQQIMEKHGGKFPSKYEDIRALKGIGDYTAAAVGSFAFGLPYATVDGNVLRFVARYAGNFNNIAITSTRKDIERFCQERLPADGASEYNQAMIEIGALVCTPTHPQCDECPLSSSCFAYINEKTNVLPFKEVKLNIRDRYFQYLILLKDNKTIIQKRTQNDIWKNLYEFPLYESINEDFNIHDFLQRHKMQTKDTPHLIWTTKHQLTHQTIHANFYVVNVNTLATLKAEQQIIDFTEIQQFAVPKIIEQVIEKLLG